MIRLVWTEIIKLKGSYMVYVCLLGAVTSPLLNFAVLYRLRSQHPDRNVTMQHYFDQTSLFVVLALGLMLFGLLVSYLLHREYQEKTLNNVLTIPVHRLAFLAAKVVVGLLWISLLMITTIVVVVLLGVVGRFTGLSLPVVLHAAWQYLVIGLCLTVLSGPVFLLTLLFRSFVPPIAFTVIAVLCNLVASNSEYAAIFPWSAILMVVYPANWTSETYGIGYSWLSILGVGLTSYVVSAIYFVRRDIK